MVATYRGSRRTPTRSPPCARSPRQQVRPSSSLQRTEIKRGRRESLHPRFLADRRFIAVKKISDRDRDRDRPNPCRCASGEHLRPTNGDYARNSSVELLLIRNASGRLRDYDGHTFLCFMKMVICPDDALLAIIVGAHHRTCPEHKYPSEDQWSPGKTN